MRATYKQIFKEKDLIFPILLTSLIGFFVFKDYLLLNKLYIFQNVASDSYNQIYPLISHISDYLRSEGIPKWSFGAGMGQNIYPGKIIQPFTLILYLLGSEKLAYGFGYIEYFKIIISALFFYLYLKKIGISYYIATVGSLLFAFSGYLIIGGGWYGHSSAVMYGAFLLFAFEKLFKDDSWWCLPLAIVLIASRSVFYLYTFGSFLLLYSIFRYVDERGWDLKGLYHLFLKQLMALLIALCISSVFMINVIMKMIDSPRVTGVSGNAMALSSFPVFGFGKFSHYLTVVLRFFSNDILGSANNFMGWRNYFEAPAFYCGLLTLLLAPQIFLFLDNRRKKIFSIYLLFWGILLLFPYFRYMFYLFIGNYYKGGLSFFVPVTLLYVSLLSFHYIDQYNKINVKLLIITLVTLLGILYYPYIEGYDIVNIAVRKKATVFLFLYAIGLFFVQYEKIKPYSKAALILVVAVELALFSSITVNDRNVLAVDELQKKVGYNDYTVEAVNFIKEKDKDFYRIEKNYSSGTAKYASTNDAQIQKYYGTPSYNSFNQKYYIKFLVETETIDPNVEYQTRWAPGLRERPYLQTLASVKYNLSKKKIDDSVFWGYNLISHFGDVSVFENTLFLPLGFTYDQTMSINDFKKLSKEQKAVSLFKAGVVENVQESIFSQFNILHTNDIPQKYSFADYSNDVNRLKEKRLQIIGHNNNTITGTITLGKARLLFLSIPYDKGWSLTVDGVLTELHVVNLGFMGAVLNKGDHTIELKYNIPYIVPCALLSFFGLILYFIVVYTLHVRKKRCLVS